MSGRPSPTAARRVVATGRRSVAARSRVARLRAGHAYGPVLALVLATFLVAALAPDGSWGGSVLVLLESTTLVCALWTSGVAHVHSRSSVALVALAVAAAVLNVAPGGRIPGGSVLLFTGLLALTSIGVIGMGVVDQGEVNRDSIRGAVAVYVLLGLLFAFLDGAIAVLGNGPLFAQGTSGTRSVRVYYSYVTLTTVGYGDYTPGASLQRTLAIVEALLGQLYLVTVVTVLVSRLRAGRRGADDGEPPLIPPG